VENDRGKEKPCEGCGGAPTHVPDSRECRIERQNDVRAAMAADSLRRERESVQNAMREHRAALDRAARSDLERMIRER
jgi:hypothetical protein